MTRSRPPTPEPAPPGCLGHLLLVPEMMAQSSGAIMDRAWLLLFLTAAFLIGSGFEAKTESTLRLRVPVECEVGKTCFIQNLVDHDPGSGASDYMCGSLTYDR